MDQRRALRVGQRGEDVAQDGTVGQLRQRHHLQLHPRGEAAQQPHADQPVRRRDAQAQVQQQQHIASRGAEQFDHLKI